MSGVGPGRSGSAGSGLNLFSFIVIKEPCVHTDTRLAEIVTKLFLVNIKQSKVLSI